MSYDPGSDADPDRLKAELKKHAKPLGASRTYQRNEHGRGFKTDARGNLVPRPYLDVEDAKRIGKAIERRAARARKRRPTDG